MRLSNAGCGLPRGVPRRPPTPRAHAIAAVAVVDVLVGDHGLGSLRLQDGGCALLLLYIWFFFFFEWSVPRGVGALADSLAAGALSGEEGDDDDAVVTKPGSDALSPLCCLTVEGQD